MQEEIPTTFSASSKKAATVAEQEALTNSPNTQQTNDHTANPFQSVAARIMSCIYDTALSASPISKTVLPDTTLQLTEPEQQELLSILENFDLPENTKEAILSGNASLRQVIHLIHKDFEQAFAQCK